MALQGRTTTRDIVTIRTHRLSALAAHLVGTVALATSMVAPTRLLRPLRGATDGRMM
jgi:hypothetical protein